MAEPPEEAAERVRQLSKNGESVVVDPNIPCRRYFVSGLEMTRMAKVYSDEGNLERAYTLYMKYMTLFIIKIREHPEYPSVPKEMKKVNQAKLKDIMATTEKLKALLLEKYTKEHYAKLAEKQKAAEERMKQMEQDEKLAETLQADELKKAKDDSRSSPSWTAVSANSITDVLYPDDFATEPNRTPLNHYDGAPPIIRQSKPNLPSTTVDSSNESLLSGGSTLRTIIVPSTLMERFLALSATNTKSNIETCGILAGKLERNKLILTHMIVPKQSGTADSCTTKNEEEIFCYQDQKNLITLGWIHTHPTQTAFLSSVDLHTQCSYQLMMPEAIAIVCAPKYNETGYFSLTPHYGMSFISNCRQTGFHPHPNDPPIFREVSHIKLDNNTPLEVIDLRK